MQYLRCFRFVALGCALALFCFANLSSVQAQERVEFTAQAVDYRFGEQLNFSAEYSSTAVILEGYVFYQVGDDERIWVYEGDATRTRLDVQVTLDESNQPQAFTTIRYWFRIASDHGEFFESPRYSFVYEDNRFTWQQAAQPPFTLLWHSGAEEEPAAILLSAQQAVTRLQDVLPLPDPPALTLRVYQQAADAQRAAQLAHYPWANGHMLPGNGVLLLVQDSTLQRQLGREIAHQMLYFGLGAQGYANLPAWLTEGIVALAEGEPDPQRQALVRAAAEAGSLPPLYTLCRALPDDAPQAHLARAQSAAVVRYLLERFNKTGFGILVEAYARSGDCIQAPQDAFGVDLLQFELDWRQTLSNQPPGALAQLDWRAVGRGALVAATLLALRWLLARRRQA